MKTAPLLDRLAPRARPPGNPVMQQNWDDLLFLHWPIEESLLRPHIPDALEIDTFDGQAWVGVTPFQVTNLRLASLPPVPGLDSFLELNVRTYVHFHGTPGVWFFSLDASKVIPAMAARLFYGLPYFKAEMSSQCRGTEWEYQSTRFDPSEAHFEAAWRTGPRLRDPDVHSLAFFLVERYYLFAGDSNELSQTRVYHHPWILEEAVVHSWKSSLLTCLGLPEPTAEPLAHFSRSLQVEIWPPARA